MDRPIFDAPHVCPTGIPCPYQRCPNGSWFTNPVLLIPEPIPVSCWSENENPCSFDYPRVERYRRTTWIVDTCKHPLWYWDRIKLPFGVRWQHWVNDNGLPPQYAALDRSVGP